MRKHRTSLTCRFASRVAAFAVMACSPVGPFSTGFAKLHGAEETDAIVRGEAIYRDACVQCHGREGEGVVDFYPDPLVGDSTIKELAELISDTMPEEDPDTCVAEDALAVATFIHHDFYSEAAQVRRRPPRAALARLTAEQLRQSLADLYSSVTGTAWTVNERGLDASYFRDSSWKDKDRKIKRVDPVVDFNFGKESPGEGIDAEAYHIHWSGSLVARATGRYEIILRTSCSCTLEFGVHGRVLIDNHVQSEGKEEFRRTMQLTGGRVYPIKLDLNQRKRKTEQPAAYVSLSWVPPGGVEEIIPAAVLLPSSEPSTFALQAKLPPDDSSYGYERGTAVNRAWEDSTTTAAIEFADAASSELYSHYLRKHKNESDENRGKLRAFLTQLVETAFRGPVDDRIRDLYINRQIDQCEDDAEAIKQVLLITLKSPRFLYPLLDADRSPSQQAANRLALTLFDSLPSDSTLSGLVEKGKLKDRKQIEQAAWGMVRDYRCQAKIREFLYQWFDLADIEEITKDDAIYPGFDLELVSELRHSFDRFIEDVLSTEGSDFRQLLQADWMFTSDRLASFYGDAWKPAEKAADGDKPAIGHTFQRSVSDSTVHVGLLTHPLLLSQLAYHRTTSPIHRGVFLTRHLLGRVLRPPNAAFSPLNPNLHPGLTTRERVELQTGEVGCQVCHVKINALGFSLENFDAAGAYRKIENKKPVDATGNYVTRKDEVITFDGARELGDFLAGSHDCHRSFVESAFEYFVKQPIAAFGPDRADELTQFFQSTGFNIRQLIVEIAVIAAEPNNGSVTGA
ncbi:DUF1592 domain-containing protein [Rubripirellula reticaptiva]|uniref:PA14 domain protein n=1 Tax=Rubripirellula reticaptiva TaxID=2528013 RepID=A0A5C6ESM1_9BACT|nr:DUF1592 domain-containing protein [Rubripirellula reticaptiva]TWU51354.1 PA14 domain protein [Rubripirellula reticaptiva]